MLKIIHVDTFAFESSSHLFISKRMQHELSVRIRLSGVLKLFIQK